jgi:arylsulfatase A-like enzyme
MLIRHGLPLVALVAAAGCARPTATAPRQPNVVLLVIEDCSPIRMGAYGNPICATPNLDRLAATGVRFDNAHTVPPCGPSRTALLTGCRPTTTGVTGNFDKERAAAWFAAHTQLQQRLQSVGYDTVRIGKIGHYGPDSAWTSEVSQQRITEALGPARTPPVPARGPATEPGAVKVGAGFTYGPTGLDDHEEGDGRMAEMACREIRAARAKPFFLAVGFHSTHLSFRAPQRYFDMYPPERMPVPQNPGALPDGMPAPGQLAGQNQFSGFGGNNPGTLRAWQESIAAQYASLTFIDAQIGRVLDELARTGHDQDTVVVVWSDHGFMLGEHFEWRKGQMYDESTRSALIVRAPGVTPAGAVHAGPTECMDLHPTLLELCGAPVPAEVEAISMVPALRDPATPYRPAALIDADAGKRSLVTARWRLNEITVDGQQRRALFDRVADPGEHIDRSGDPACAGMVAELSALMAGGWRAAAGR